MKSKLLENKFTFLSKKEELNIFLKDLTSKELAFYKAYNSK